MFSYGSVKRAVLELVNQYSCAGEEIPPAYNNQADSLRKIPNLINQAILKIRSAALPDRRTAELSALEPYRGCVRCALPPNCKSIVSGGVFCLDTDGPRRIHGFTLLGGDILLPAQDAGKRCFVEYFAYPQQIPADAPDDYDVAETPEVIQAAEYYAAAMLVMMEDEFSYTALMNEFHSRLAAMRPPLTAEVHPVRDVYAFQGVV